MNWFLHGPQLLDTPFSNIDFKMKYQSGLPFSINYYTSLTDYLFRFPLNNQTANTERLIGTNLINLKVSITHNNSSQTKHSGWYPKSFWNPLWNYPDRFQNSLISRERLASEILCHFIDNLRNDITSLRPFPGTYDKRGKATTGNNGKRCFKRAETH